MTTHPSTHPNTPNVYIDRHHTDFTLAVPVWCPTCGRAATWLRNSLGQTTCILCAEERTRP